VTVPPPMPVAPEVIVIQEKVLDADQAQVEATVTPAVNEPPLEPGF